MPVTLLKFLDHHYKCMGGILSPDVKFSAHYGQIPPRRVHVYQWNVVVMWWQHVSLLWWSMVSVHCEVYQEISVLMLKRSVGNCVSTTIWFSCLVLFCAGLCQNECETGAEQQSRNHHIWNRSPPQTHDAQYSRPCWQLKWQSLCYSKTHDSNVLCYYSAPGGQLKTGVSFCQTLYKGWIKINGNRSIFHTWLYFQE